MHVWMFCNSWFRLFLFMFMSWLWMMWLMIWFDSNCYGFLAMLALICLWFHKKWCKIEHVMLIWKWALSLRRCARFWTIRRLKMMWWHIMIGLFEFFGLFEFLFYLIFCLILFAGHNTFKNHKKIIVGQYYFLVFVIFFLDFFKK